MLPLHTSLKADWLSFTLWVRAQLALNTTCLPHKSKSALDFQFSSLNFAEKKIYEKLLSFLDMNKCSYALINCRKWKTNKNHAKKVFGIKHILQLGNWKLAWIYATRQFITSNISASLPRTMMKKLFRNIWYLYVFSMCLFLFSAYDLVYKRRYEICMPNLSCISC